MNPEQINNALERYKQQLMAVESKLQFLTKHNQYGSFTQLIGNLKFSIAVYKQRIQTIIDCIENNRQIISI